MSGNYYTPFSLRVSENLLDKIKIIAEENKRSANKEIEYALTQYVKKYEAENGKIEVDDKGTV
ncbi:MAG: Arc family DNA-binding protein [Hominilimicola sp.]